MKMAPDCFGVFWGDYGGEGFGGGLPDAAEAAEMGDQALAGLGVNAGDVQQLEGATARVAGRVLRVVLKG
jgi:hypothetical protein